MKIINTKIKGLFIVKQKNNSDKRGSLREIYNKKKIKKNKLILEKTLKHLAKLLK